ncbi:hypothetical protein MMC31_001000 [Peltigera leucophlebia]|nr:hypothetical protein [Peltigera leucophlebia]
MERFQWLKRANLGLENASSMKLPDRQLYGHCAETIALSVKMRKYHISRRKSIHGICLDAKNFNRENICPAKLEDHIIEPCLNCQELIRKFEGDIKNFGVPTVAAAKLPRRPRSTTLRKNHDFSKLVNSPITGESIFTKEIASTQLYRHGFSGLLKRSFSSVWDAFWSYCGGHFRTVETPFWSFCDGHFQAVGTPFRSC